MAESHRRTAGGSSRLTPEEITNRGFASAFRGISETEVRNFLKRVADEITSLRSREEELDRQVAELQDQLAHPSPVTEEQLLGSLGEETARVLRSAQEAAEEIRKRAEERAGALVKEAQESSTKLREEAHQEAETRRSEAEQRATELEQQAESRARALREEAEGAATELRERAATETDEQREQATAVAAGEIERAKESGRSLVDEARTVRERVLADLGRRRSLLQAQVDELRSGRDRLLDAYRIVKRTLSDATDALAQVEARANAELAAPAPHVTVPPVEGELEILEAAPGTSTAATAEVAAEDAPAEIDLEAEAMVVVDGEESPGTDRAGGDGPGGPDDSGEAVDALFARLRASHTTPATGAVAPPGAGAEAAAPDGAEDGADAPAAPADAEPAAGDAPSEPSDAPEATAPADPAADSEPAVDVASTGTDGPAATGEAPLPDEALRAERAEIMGPLARDLNRAAKRALQDQQNELLDQIRTVKGQVGAEAVVPAADDLATAWVAVLEEPLRTAYSRASESISSDEAPTADVGLPDGLLRELADAMVGPWRARLVAAIDGAGDDTDAITQRLGARYRQYRGRELESALGDALAAAWARGAYAAVPDGTLLRWVPAEVGHCPDCDDNALEPTARNEPFPTGQLFPPAHPGCRCFLAVVESVPAT